jgi:IS5 family transposase
MFRWLIWKQLMSCSYRDLEGMSGIDYSTFIKFRKRLIAKQWFARVFNQLSSSIVSGVKPLFFVLDSSFVETYSKNKEKGSEYSGFKEKNGFKLHQIIDFQTRLPLKQRSTGGARPDITLGKNLVRGAPRQLKVQALVADKGYDSQDFVHQICRKWPGVKVGIPLRRTNQAARNTKRRETILNQFLKAAERCLDQELFDKRSEIERYFSRIKRVFNLGEERTRGLTNFRANCYLVSVARILEYLASPSLWWQLFTKL